MSQIVEAGVAPSLVASEREGLLTWVASVDHKQIGILYMISSMFFFLVGGIEALVIRIQLARAGLAPRLAGNLRSDVHHARHHDDLSCS